MLITADIQDIFNALKPFECRLVGGIVRDYLSSKCISKDVDIATTAPPQYVLITLQKAGMHVIPTGLKHGTVTAIYHHKPYEITTLRHDIQTDGRHAKVRFTDNFKEDAKRRDFTFNALYMNENGEIFDYFHGQDDLKKGLVQFIGPAEQRIKEDYLRILRYFRFYGKFQKTPCFDDETLKIIQKNASHIQTLSAERITSELFKILSSVHAPCLIKTMQQVKICHYIGLKNGQLEALKTLIHYFPESSPILRFACLYQQYKYPHFIKKVRLNFTNKEKSYLRQLFLALHTFNLNPQKNIEQQSYLLGKNICLALFMIKACQTNKINQKLLDNIQQLKKLIPPVFPLSGADLIKEGFQTGKELGTKLKEIENWWLNNHFPSKSRCLKQLKHSPNKIQK